MKPHKQTIYLPVKVEDELPENNKNVFCLTSDDFETELVFEDGVFRVYEGGDCYENENVTHWLKSQEAFVFTPEQLNEYTQNVIKQALETAAENVNADFEPMGWLAEQHMSSPFIPGEDYEIGISRSSITELFEETFKKFEV